MSARSATTSSAERGGGKARAFIALGTNVGNRLLNLREAVRRLRLLGAVREGLIIETAALLPKENPAPQPPYLNTVVELTTSLGPIALFHHLKRIERVMGRVTTTRWAPRIIDLDLVLFGTQTVSTPELTVPHPRAHERDFVKGPLRYFGVEL